MRETVEMLLSYLHGVWRYKWIMMVVAWAVTIGSWIYIHQLPDRYESTARVYVDTTTILGPLLRGLAVQHDLSRQIKLMTRVLLSRPNLEKIVHMTDLDLSVKGPREMDQLVNRLGHAISIRSASRTEQNLYLISAAHEDRQVAKKIVQSLLTIFVESTLGETRRDSDTAQRFLDQQIQDYEVRLIEAETRLKEFKSRNLGLMPNQGGGYYERLQQAMAAEEQASLELREAINRRNELKRQLEFPDGEKSGFMLGGSELDSSYDPRIASLETRLDGLLLRFTEQHPDVQSIRETIAQLQDSREEELAAGKGEIGSNASPIYQQMRIALGKAQATVAAARARVSSYKAKIEGFKEVVGATLEVEAELQNLNRDYDVTKKNHVSLLLRREKARISEDADRNAENVKFKIVDPPYVPDEPSSPNRMLLNILALFFGTASGLGLALATFLFRPTFESRRILKDTTMVPVLGSISMVWTQEQRYKQRMDVGSFIVASVALLIVFGSVMLADVLNLNIIGTLMDVKDSLL